MVKSMVAEDFLECRHKTESGSYYIYHFNEWIEILLINDRILTTGRKLQNILNSPSDETFIQLFIQRDTSEDYEQQLMSITAAILDTVQHTYCSQNR